MSFLDAGGTDATAGERLATALGGVPPHPPAASLRSSPRAPDGDRAGPAPGQDGAEPWAEPRPDGPEPWGASAPGRPGRPETAEPGGSGRWGALRRLLDGGRADPGLPGARALAVAGVGAALVAAGCLWLSRPHPQPVSAPVSAPAPAGAATLAVPAAARGRGPVPGPAAGSAPVVVHVAGRVRRPGVVTLPAGARVTDAITAAGGVRPGAGTGPLNLARKVVDGEQILVGVPGAPGAQAGPVAPGAAQPGAGAPAAGAPAGGDPAGPLDLNTATSEQLQRLPGVGPVLAQRIIDFRAQQGGFRGVEELRQVSGIGARRFADLRDRVRV